MYLRYLQLVCQAGHPFPVPQLYPVHHGRLEGWLRRSQAKAQQTEPVVTVIRARKPALMVSPNPLSWEAYSQAAYRNSGNEAVA